VGLRPCDARVVAADRQVEFRDTRGSLAITLTHLRFLFLATASPRILEP
jgi:hypothetical protein